MAPENIGVISSERFNVGKGAYIKYVGGGGGGAVGFTNLLKNIRSPGDHRPKYFMVQ